MRVSPHFLCWNRPSVIFSNLVPQLIDSPSELLQSECKRCPTRGHISYIFVITALYPLKHHHNWIAPVDMFDHYYLSALDINFVAARLQRLFSRSITIAFRKLDQDFSSRSTSQKSSIIPTCAWKILSYITSQARLSRYSMASFRYSEKLSMAC